MDKSWIEVYSEAVEVANDKFGNASASPLYSVEISRWINRNYEQKFDGDRLTYQFKGGR